MKTLSEFFSFLVEGEDKPVILYHGTLRSRLDSIMSGGLKAAKSKSSLKAVFLTDDVGMAQNYTLMDMKKGDKPVVLRIDVSKLDQNKLGPDNYELQEFLDGEMGDVPEELEGMSWNDLSWKESLQYVNQAAYHGDIPPEAIHVIRVSVMRTFQEFFAFLTEETTGYGSPVEEIVQQLQSLEGLKDIERFLNQELGEPVAGGFSRRIWNLSATKIVKVVRTEDANTQNKREVEHATCLGQKFAPVIYQYDRKNFLWIIEERLSQIDEEYLFDFFEEKFQYRFKDWVELKQFFQFISHTQRSKESYPELTKLFTRLLNTNEWFQTFSKELWDCDVNSEDFHSDNWGVRRSTGEVVLLDLGF